MNLGLKSFLFLSSLVGSFSSAAVHGEDYETITISSGSSVVTQGQTENITLPETMFIKKLEVEASQQTDFVRGEIWISFWKMILGNRCW